jgi:hypothetical protein
VGATPKKRSGTSASARASARGRTATSTSINTEKAKDDEGNTGWRAVAEVGEGEGVV